MAFLTGGYSGIRDFAKKACPSFDVRTMFSVVLAALMIMSVACTRKIYIPVENVAVRSDTVYVSKNAVARGGRQGHCHCPGSAEIR